MLDTRVYSWYGQSERVILAGECEHNSSYHIFPFYGIVELLDKDGEVIEEPGQRGEIVGTGFLNTIAPFIRYRTGDIGMYDDFITCKCERSYRRLKTVEGRKQDYIITGTGKKVPLTAFVFGQHFRAFEKLYKMQLYQDKAGEITVRIIPKGSYSTTDEEEIRRKMSNAVDGDILINFDSVKEVQKTASGKELFLIQKTEIQD